MAADSSRWSLDSEAFERLLARLGPDREQASRVYEATRRKLVDFFDWRNAATPDALADETIDRVARKLDEGAVIEQLSAYIYAVARHVLQERYRRATREQAALDRLARSTPVLTSIEEDDPRLRCLTQCLDRLPSESRTLIVAYYEGNGRAYLKERKALAGHLGIEYATLKTRAHRVRGVLEACMKKCVGDYRAGNQSSPQAT